MSRYLSSIALLLIVLAFSEQGAAQSTPCSKVNEQTSGTKETSDPETLRCQAVELEAAGKPRDARQLYEQAFKVAHKNFSIKLSERLGKDPSSKEPLMALLNSLIPILEFGAESAKSAVRLKAPMAMDRVLLFKANSMLELRRFIATGETVYSTDEPDTRIKLTLKPRPNYTDAARGGGTSGKVILLVVLAANGSVGFATPIEPLPNGLTDEALIAVKKVKFDPAIKDGKPVSTMMLVDYSFSFG